MMNNKPLSYTDKQMIHTLRNNGETIRAIQEALGFSVGVIHKIIHEDIELLGLPEVIGDGCYSISTTTGEMIENSPVDYEDDLSLTDNRGQITKLESGYPDIYYNERSKQWEIWLGGKRIWRAGTLTKACEVRLAKGSLLAGEIGLLQSVVDAEPEIQEALNYPPI